MKLRFVYDQFFHTTMQDEQDYFWGEYSEEVAPKNEDRLPSGNYRLVAGDLYRVVPGLPPTLHEL